MPWLLLTPWLLTWLVQTPPACSLSGSIRDSKNAAVAGAVIRASPTGVAKTDGKGFFCLAGLPPGTYSLSVTAARFQPYTRNGLSIDGDAARSLGTIRMRPAESTSSAAGQVRVTNSAYLAENGRNATGVISLMTPAGGKRFHGSVEWGHRHESYAANDFFNNRSGIVRPRSRGQTILHTLSGPLCIPGLSNCARTKLVFFLSQEIQKDLAGFSSRTVRVPTGGERAGDFSQSFDVSGRPIPIYDPLDGQRPFPGQAIPRHRFDESGANILKLFPAPNFNEPAPSRAYQWNYISPVSRSSPRRTEILRLDYAARKNLQIYGRFNHTHDEQRWQSGPAGGGAMNFPLTPILFRRPLGGIAIHASATLSPKTTNAFYFGMSRDQRRHLPEWPERVSRKPTGIDLPQWNPAVNPEGLLPNMTFAGVPNYANPSLGNSIPFVSSNRLFSFVDNLSKTSARHAYKFGVYIERSLRDEDASLVNRGTLSFDRDRTNPFDSNHPYANVLLGSYQSYSEPSARPRGLFRFTNLEIYAQDAWRVRPNLLIDYGVRVHHNPPQYDRRMQLAAFVPALFQPGRGPALLEPALDGSGSRVALDRTTGATYPEALIGMVSPSGGNRAAGMAIGGKSDLPPGLYSLPAVTVGPRFGISWDPFRRGRTVLRAGGGAFYDRISFTPLLNTLTNAPTVYTMLSYYGTLEKLSEAAAHNVTAPAGNITSLLGRNRMPSVYQFSFGIQQQVRRGIFVQAAYAGSLSRHLLWQRNINPVPAGANHLDVHPENQDPTAPSRPMPRNFLRPYRGLGDIQLIEFASTANYNSLQLTVNRAMGRGVQVTASYLFSKALGSAAGEGAAVSPFFAPRDRNYGPLPWDTTHALSVQYGWALPKVGKRLGWRGLALMTDGWEISGVARFCSGSPFTPGFSTVDGQDITGTPSEPARAEVWDGQAPSEMRFMRAPRGSLGNSGVGILRARGINNWDTSALRRVKLSERLTLQVRLETYNTFNHTQFSAKQPSARFDRQGVQVDPMFLQPIAARSPRRVQLNLRLVW